jgi:hypothetical protein
MLDFWVVTPCVYQSFYGTYCLRPQAETLVSSCKSARRYNSEDQHRRLHRRENLKPHILNVFIDTRTMFKTEISTEIRPTLSQPLCISINSFTIAFLGVLQALQIVIET